MNVDHSLVTSCNVHKMLKIHLCAHSVGPSAHYIRRFYAYLAVEEGEFENARD